MYNFHNGDISVSQPQIEPFRPLTSRAGDLFFACIYHTSPIKIRLLFYSWFFSFAKEIVLFICSSVAFFLMGLGDDRDPLLLRIEGVIALAVSYSMV